jgi:cysteine desulfurase family protein (TIGR01976 family)
VFDVQSARLQFPALHRISESGNLPIFFDNPAGTQVPRQVIEAVTNYYETMNANSGGVFTTSRNSDAMVKRVREQAALFLNANRSDEIAFGPNMTTLNFALSRALARTLESGDEIVLTRMDHDAHVAPWLRIAADCDLVIRWVDIDTTDCTLDLSSFEAALTEKTKIVATCHASNAVGTVNPVGQIAEMAHAAGALYIIDAVQSAPHIPIDVRAIGCDFLLCSAYKFFGPHIGLMWGRHDLMSSLPAYKVRPSKDIPPYRWEIGTPSFETIAGVGGAFDYLNSIGGVDAFVPYERELAAHLLDVLRRVKGVQVYGITDTTRIAQRVPTVVFTMEGYTPEEVATYLAQHDIYVWHGNYYAVEIMERLGHSENGMVRVGLAHYNTHEEIDRFESVLKGI